MTARDAMQIIHKERIRLRKSKKWWQSISKIDKGLTIAYEAIYRNGIDELDREIMDLKNKIKQH